MRSFRKLIQQWTRTEDGSIASNKSKASQTSIPMQHFMQTLESKLDSQLGSVMKEVRNAISAIPSTVEKTVTAEVGNRL